MVACRAGGGGGTLEIGRRATSTLDMASARGPASARGAASTVEGEDVVMVSAAGAVDEPEFAALKPLVVICTAVGGRS